MIKTMADAHAVRDQRASERGINDPNSFLKATGLLQVHGRQYSVLHLEIAKLYDRITTLEAQLAATK